MSSRRTFSLAIGVVMVGLGAFVALRPLWAGRRPLTGQPFLDVAFALFFVLRGLMYLRAVRRADARPRGPADAAP